MFLVNKFFFFFNTLKVTFFKMQSKFLYKYFFNYYIKNYNMRKQFYSVIFRHIDFYPTPVTINYFWSFGFLAGIALTFQIITGFFLVFHYTTFLPFFEVETIMKNVNFGWLFRYGHANGASFMFITLYLHIAKALFYKSFFYQPISLWISGFLLYMCSMATAFLGYVLPWGQMSLWGATVITNLFSVIPEIGNQLTYLLWGGFAVTTVTVKRFFAIHFLLPIFMIYLVFWHLFILHIKGSSQPGPTQSYYVSYKSFSFYFLPKDLVSLSIFFGVYGMLVFYNPNVLSHPDNYILANNLVTPTHIVPEWYFLPFYAILRGIPNKSLGVILMMCSIFFFIFLPSISRFYNIVLNRSKYFQEKVFFVKQYKQLCIQFFINFLILGWLGAQNVKLFYVIGSQVSTFYYFFLLICLCLV